MAKTIMIQGTASNAGKSLIVAGLCRVFKQDGYRVAPFKSQNMALNSYVTEDGLEMGRAQVTQAECAGIKPDVRMNPVLLKPTGDDGSQVIVNGEVTGNMRAREYYAHKREMIRPIKTAFESLASEHDIIVLEGAGSPAEINLKEFDIVNMGMAKLAGSPVLLAGDIDRGGVFASLFGTLALLDKGERELVKGVIINKFRGDRELLSPGLEMLSQLIKKPVLGVVPFMDIDVDDEDSLSARLSKPRRPELVDIAVIRLPRLSNFTDFSVFETLPGVSLRYIGSPRELLKPDLIILPGSKNTMGDLAWLRGCGLESGIMRHAGAGGPVFGVCGGYQMMCETLDDPAGAEHGGSMSGLGLLPGRTEFLPRKTRGQATGKFLPLSGIFAGLSGMDFEGYEIHMGKTLGDAPPLVSVSHGGAPPVSGGMALGNICGCYIHGIFDSRAVCREIVRALAEKKGVTLPSDENISGVEYRESQYDTLADTLRQSLCMEQIYRILKEGV